MSRQAQRGETLVGLLVGLAVGLLVLAAATSMLAQLFQSQRLGLQDNHAQQDLQWSIGLIGRELQNAQYVANAWLSRSPDTCTDPFCDGPEDLQVSSTRLDFSLDRNHNGAQDNDECTGLRLNAGALQVRTACHPEVWGPLSDTQVLRISRLDMQLHCLRQAGWVHRSVHLRIEAQAPTPSQQTLVIERQVPLRNALPDVAQTSFCP